VQIQSFLSKFWPPSALWLVVVLLQAVLTPIHSDEAYYWMYAQHLDWGYFDHPPAVAFLIWCGSSVLPGILGVRLGTVVVHFATLYLLYDLVGKRNKAALIWFWPIVWLLPLLHVYAFIATPDAPLLLSVALFLYAYHQILERSRVVDYLLAGVSMALMMYAKYHGMLVVGFVVMSNLRLLRDVRWHMAMLIGFCLFLPHLYWQYQHDWVSVRFHLEERRGVSLWYHQLEYLGNLAAIYSPFLVWLVWRWTRTSVTVFDRSLKWIFWGMVAFFSYQTLRDHVQPQWLYAAYVPFILLTINTLRQSDTRWLKWAGLCSFAILGVLRVALVVDFLPDTLGVHRKQDKTQRIAALAEGRPVVFIDSYQNASAYAWYQASPQTHSIHTEAARRSQYALWQLDSSINGKEVFVVGNEGMQMPYKKWDKDLFGISADFISYEHLRPDSIMIDHLPQGLVLSGCVCNNYTFPVFPQRDSIGLAMVGLAKNRAVTPTYRLLLDIRQLNAGECYRFRWEVKDWPSPAGLTDIGMAPYRVGWPVGALKRVGR
jgi:Dolichyl-phosphate-mannose-protein mannosyltransferase